MPASPFLRLDYRVYGSHAALELGIVFADFVTLYKDQPNDADCIAQCASPFRTMLALCRVEPD